MSKKHKAAVQKQFARTVEVFSKTAVRDKPEVFAEQVGFAKPQTGETALDVACGPGMFVLDLAGKVGFAHGVDLTPEMLRQAREFQTERGIANADFCRGEAEQLPYADQSFDLVSCQFAFHHIQKPELVLREMLRVTKPGGRIFVDDTLGPESDEKFDLHNRIEIIRDPSHVSSWRLTTFLSWFENLGLEILAQSFKRRPRSFKYWMLRSELRPGDQRYEEARKLITASIPGDKAGFSPQPRDDDFEIVHQEGLFLLRRQAEV